MDFLWVYFIMFIAVLFAAGTQTNKIPCEANNHNQGFTYCSFDKRKFIISYLLLAITCFICVSGNDTLGYAIDFKRYTWSSISDTSTEPGYVLLNLLLHLFINNEFIGIGFVKIIALALVYRAIYLLRDRINVGLAVFGFCCLLYVYYFQLLRMAFAVGMCFLGMSHYITGRKYWGTILVVLSCMFHYSSFSVIMVFLIYIFFFRKEIIGSFKPVLIYATVIIGFLLSNAMIEFLTNNVFYFQKYTKYVSEASSSSGLGQLIIFIPVLLLLLSYYKYEKHSKFYILASLFAMLTFGMGLLGYMYPVITRSTYYFYYFYIFYVPTIPLKSGGNNILIKTRNSSRLSIQELGSVLYLLFMCIWYHANGGISGAGLDVFKFIWNV